MKPVMHWFQRLLSHDRRKADRRKTGRQETPRLVAYYWDGGAPVAHHVRNISSTGFYLLTEARWLPGTLVVMTLQTGGGDGGSELHSIAVQSKVVRLGEDGVGLTFELPEGHHSRARHGLETNVADKKTLGRFLLQL